MYHDTDLWKKENTPIHSLITYSVFIDLFNNAQLKKGFHKCAGVNLCHLFQLQIVWNLCDKYMIACVTKYYSSKNVMLVLNMAQNQLST